MGEVIQLSDRFNKDESTKGILLGYTNMGGGFHRFDGLVKVEKGNHTFLRSEELDERKETDFFTLHEEEFLKPGKKFGVEDNGQIQGMDGEDENGRGIFGYFTGHVKEGTMFRLNYVRDEDKPNHIVLSVIMKEEEGEINFRIPRCINVGTGEPLGEAGVEKLMSVVSEDIIEEVALIRAMEEIKRNQQV